MRTPIFVRPLTDAERQALSAGLRSKDTFVVRRCQILLASARGERAPRIAERLSCDDQPVLDGLHAFNVHGLDALVKRSSRAHHPRPQAFPGERAEQLRALLHRRPRDFGHPTSVWTLELAAKGKLQTLVAWPKVRGLWCSRLRSRSRLAASKTACGR